MNIQLGPKWLELIPNFRILAKPVSRIMYRNASTAYVKAKEQAMAADGLPEDDANVIGDEAFNRSLAVQAILDWGSDVEDADGNPAPVTPDNVNLLMDQYGPYNGFVELYVRPFIESLNVKNASWPTSNGSPAPAPANPTA